MTGHILLVGCGAIADLIYLPVLATDPWRHRVRCVDPNERVLRETTSRHGFAPAGPDYHPLLSEAAVAIIATPPRFHYPIARDCLEAGLHVISEKPLTDTHAEAVLLVEAARKAGRLLMVNNTRRLYQSSQRIRDLLTSGELGEVLSIDYSEGAPFAWPTASGFYFDPSQGGRGVLADRGSHVLDLFCWWCSNQPTLLECRFDRDGGVEGFCDVRLGLPRGQARLRLSWHNKLANRIRIRCARGEIEAGIYDFREIMIRRNGRARRAEMPAAERTFEDYGRTFIKRALDAAVQNGIPPVVASDVLPSLALIDDCYARQQNLDFEWLYKFRQASG